MIASIGTASFASCFPRGKTQLASRSHFCSSRERRACVHNGLATHVDRQARLCEVDTLSGDSDDAPLRVHSLAQGLLQRLAGCLEGDSHGMHRFGGLMRRVQDLQRSVEAEHLRLVVHYNQQGLWLAEGQVVDSLVKFLVRAPPHPASMLGEVTACQHIRLSL